jgi:hypothetical protein
VSFSLLAQAARQMALVAELPSVSRRSARVAPVGAGALGPLGIDNETVGPAKR